MRSPNGNRGKMVNNVAKMVSEVPVTVVVFRVGAVLAVGSAIP